MISITILMWNSTKLNPGEVWILSRYFPSYQKDNLPEKRNDTVVCYVHKSEVFFCYPFPIHKTSQQRFTDTLFHKNSTGYCCCSVQNQHDQPILSWEIIYIKQIFYWQNIVYSHTFPFSTTATCTFYMYTKIKKFKVKNNSLFVYLILISHSFNFTDTYLYLINYILYI